MYNIIRLFVVALWMCLSGCGQSSLPDGMKCGSIMVDTMMSLTEKAKSEPCCRISLNIKYLKGRNVQNINEEIINSNIFSSGNIRQTGNEKNIRRAVDSFIKKYLSDYRDSYRMMYINDKEHAGSYNYSYELDTNIETNKKGIITYIAKITTRNGNDNGTCQTLVKNIDINTGRTLTLTDIFRHGYEYSVLNILRDKVHKRLDTINRDNQIEETLTDDADLFIPNNFIIRTSKITFIYNESEIASRKIGEITVDIDNDELNGLLK